MFEDEHTVNDPSIWVKLDHDRETLDSLVYVRRETSLVVRRIHDEIWTIQLREPSVKPRF